MGQLRTMLRFSKASRGYVLDTPKVKDFERDLFRARLLPPKIVMISNEHAYISQNSAIAESRWGRIMIDVKNNLEKLRSSLGNTIIAMQQLQEKASIDFLSTATRDFINKLIIASTIGIIIGTVDSMDKQVQLGPIKIDIDTLYFIPISIIFVIIYYAIGVAILSMADYRRWVAIYAQGIGPFAEVFKLIEETLTQNIKDLKGEQQEILDKIARGENVGPIDDDGIPVIVKEIFKPYEILSSSLTQMKLYMANVGIRMKKQSKVFLVFFTLFPLLYGFVASSISVHASLALYSGSASNLTGKR